MKSIIVDYDLREDFTPEIIIRNLEDLIDSRLPLRVGDITDLRLDESRYCIGYHIRDEYHEYLPCPDRQEIKKGFQCSACRSRDTLNPCISCNGTNCAGVKHPAANCTISTTSVYLVSFGNEKKVGVSIRDRLLKRWIEQGSDWGIEVGYGPNGSIARLAENEISRSMEVSKSMRLETKLNTIGRDESEPPKLLELAHRCLDVAREKYPDFHEGNLSLVDLRKSYNMKIDSAPFKFDTSGESHISGEFVGMKGPLLFFRNNVLCFVDFRALKGRLIGAEEGSKQMQLAAFT